MTLQELYQNMEGDYDQALRVLRMDRLVDKHIRKFPQNISMDELIAAKEDLNPERLFDSSHALKGICASLGLKGIADIATEISDEFRPGSSRKMTDEEVVAKIEQIARLYQKAKEEILRYSQS